MYVCAQGICVLWRSSYDMLYIVCVDEGQNSLRQKCLFIAACPQLCVVNRAFVQWLIQSSLNKLTYIQQCIQNT